MCLGRSVDWNIIKNGAKGGVKRIERLVEKKEERKTRQQVGCRMRNMQRNEGLKMRGGESDMATDQLCGS